MIPMFIVPILLEMKSLVHDLGDVALTVLFGALLFVAVAISFTALVTRPEYLHSAWAAAIALLPLASLIQFWYQTFYLPAHERPTVNVQAELEEVRREGVVSQMRGTVTLENVGKAALSTLGSVYSVSGHDVGAGDHPMMLSEVRGAVKRNRVPWADGGPYRGVLKVGRLIRPGGHLTPGQKISTTVVFDVRNDEQQKLRLTVQLSLLVYADELNIKKCPKGSGRDWNFPSCLEASVPASNWFREYLGDRPVVRTIVTFSSKSAPDLITKFQISDWDPKGKRGASAAQEISPFMVSRGVTTSTEFRLDP